MKHENTNDDVITMRKLAVTGFFITLVTVSIILVSNYLAP